jgi:hypothetical protein
LGKEKLPSSVFFTCLIENKKGTENRKKMTSCLTQLKYAKHFDVNGKKIIKRKIGDALYGLIKLNV